MSMNLNTKLGMCFLDKNISDSGSCMLAVGLFYFQSVRLRNKEAENCRGAGDK